MTQILESHRHSVARRRGAALTRTLVSEHRPPEAIEGCDSLQDPEPPSVVLRPRPIENKVTIREDVPSDPPPSLNLTTKLGE
ncbi:MAG TPA: hypothetical protein VM580_07360 [Labilithrix sp.]|nr:hypothetical protein [Labilithrix sp.]